MPRFVFKLEAVLQQRQNIEQQRKRELAVAQGRRVQLESELRALETARRAAEQDLRQNRLIGRVDLAFVTAYRRYALATQKKGLAIAQKLAAAMKLVEEAQRNLIEAAKRRKAIEKLRERQFLRWREDIARRELAELDEMAMKMNYQAIQEESNLLTDASNQG